MSTRIVTFDAGQTLVELDLDFLATRLRERDVRVAAGALYAASPGAWAHYEARVEAGVGHEQLWRELMAELIEGAGVTADVAEHVEWLRGQQLAHNLFRKPIADMVELARELAAAGVRVGVLSNSEGRLAELLEQVGIARHFAAIIDSGRVGIEKPDPRIFELARDALGAPPGTPAVHVGDSWSADIAGALGAGWRAVWYGRFARATIECRAARDARGPRVAIARDAAGVRAALVGFEQECS